MLDGVVFGAWVVNAAVDEFVEVEVEVSTGVVDEVSGGVEE